MRAFLKIPGLRALRDAARPITLKDLQSHGSQKFAETVYDNPLKRTFQHLGSILIQRGREDTERESAQVKQVWETKAARKKQAAVIETTELTDEIHPIPGPRQSSVSPTTPQKRKVSAASFGTDSAETTPVKLVKPEPNIQNLQNAIVYDILDAIYHTDVIRVPWARGRKNMRLQYESYLFDIIPF